MKRVSLFFKIKTGWWSQFDPYQEDPIRGPFLLNSKS
ncbi:hypothetical protein SSM1_214 [Synechococcus phage S-SM1]|uniref:Uncharacterized protein n=1 Tax=Synechococcus phage S-SM1 TaxID=444859 RepID=E3SIM0_9CAUD|nr:hypothetical protein SSM1_214 [Synechococcus phage S-SM1]ADO97137.1 hypothetical protein SSM1_214 [Synechococcus phage S-SM1]